MGGQAPESAPASSARNSGWEAFKAVVLISILALVCATTGLSARTYNIVKHRGWETKISLVSVGTLGFEGKIDQELVGVTVAHHMQDSD